MNQTQILKSFELIVAGKPEKPNMDEVDMYAWAVCDTCGEWCNPADGELCWNCGEMWDEEKRPDEQVSSFVLEALEAMAEREFFVKFLDRDTSELHGISVLDTGKEKAGIKANERMEKICIENGRDFASFQMLSIENEFECDDPRFGER